MVDLPFFLQCFCFHFFFDKISNINILLTCFQTAHSFLSLFQKQKCTLWNHWKRMDEFPEHKRFLIKTFLKQTPYFIAASSFIVYSPRKWVETWTSRKKNRTISIEYLIRKDVEMKYYRKEVTIPFILSMNMLRACNIQYTARNAVKWLETAPLNRMAVGHEIFLQPICRKIDWKFLENKSI